MCILREGAHERQIDVHVRIDETGEDILPSALITSQSGGASMLRSICVMRFVCAKDIRDVAFAAGDDFAAFDQKTHETSDVWPAGKIRRSLFKMCR